MRSGFGDADPYVESDGTPNKETRVRTVIASAVRRPKNARELMDGLIAEMRAAGCFAEGSAAYDAERIANLGRALARTGWELSPEGELHPTGVIDVTTGGRAALEEQLGRLRRSTEDPALLIGTAKDLLEAVAKFVLEELDFPYRTGADFQEVWYLARERLGIHPKDIDVSVPGGPQMRTIIQSAWAIAEAVNEFRGAQGTGHGRTMPAGVSSTVALFVVRQACLVAEFTIAELDRQRGGGRLGG
jgi:hypothetical protein